MLITTIIGFGTVIALIYYLIKRQYSYWERKGIIHIKPTIPHGNFKQLGKIFQGHMIQNYYNEMKGKGKFFGIYGFHDPIAIPTDLDFIKSVLIKDFDNFRDRGFYSNKRDDPLSAHLFSMEGNEWRQLRTKLTPTFTSGKMKFMYPTILKVSDELISTIDEQILANTDGGGGENGITEIEVRDMFGRFTTDVIGECAFGIDCNSLKNPDVEFRKMGKLVFKIDKWQIVFFIFASTFPNFVRSLHLKSGRPEIEQFFMSIVGQTVSYREKNSIKRNDFMDLLIKLKNNESFDEKGNRIEGITLNELTAQAFIFFLAGFETSSSVMTYATYELALNPDIQTRARKQVMDVLNKFNGDLSYEAIMEMGYLDQILQESLRKHPIVPVLNLVVTKPFAVPGTNFTFEANTKVWIPVYSLHHDPEYYPNPSKFDPERFTPEMIRDRNSATYLPFGDGPRNCIGLRFGMMQSRIGLARLLMNFELLTCDKTMIPMEYSKRDFNLTPASGVYLKFKKIVK